MTFEPAAGLEAALLHNREALLRFLKARGAGDAAEDLLQELWLKSRSQPAGPIAQPLAYLYRMANNLMLDRRRAEQRSGQREQHWVEESLAGTDPDGEAALLARAELREVAQTLASLGDRTDAVFRRFRLDGLPQHEIAREMGISLSAVEKHLQRAYRALLTLRNRTDAE